MKYFVMKTNLLLLDSYKNIEDLIAFAFSFSNQTNRHLKIVYVFDFDWMRQTFLVGSAGPVDPALVAVEKNAKKEFNVAEAKIRDVAAGYLKKHTVKIPFEINITEQNRIDVVQDELESSTDLILLISNHQSYSEASGGLVGYPNLIEHVTCPVFVVPEKTRHAVMRKIVYASDFHPNDIEAIKHVLGLIGKADDTEITILHNEKDYTFDNSLKWAGFKTLVQEQTDAENLGFSLKTKKDFVNAVRDFDEENNPDLLVILKEKRGFFEEIFTSSDTRSVLTHFDKPVLVYHEN